MRVANATTEPYIQFNSLVFKTTPEKMTNEVPIPVFGQVIVGPPGSGKTTYCRAIAGLLKEIGERRPVIVNLDPAAEFLTYEPDVDVTELVNVEDVMKEMDLGPNGALIYCMEFLEQNYAWLESSLIDVLKNRTDTAEQSQKLQPYLLIDCPGQVELYTHHNSFKNILKKLLKSPKPNISDSQLPATTSNHDEDVNDKKDLDLRLVCTNLVDSFYASDPSKFISTLLCSLTTMLHMELPHVNILSKADLIEEYGKTQFGIDFYCDVMDMKYIVDLVSDDPFMAKYKKLTEALADVIESYALVSYLPLKVKSKKSLLRALLLADKANGFFMSSDPRMEVMQDLCDNYEKTD